MKIYLKWTIFVLFICCFFGMTGCGKAAPEEVYDSVISSLSEEEFYVLVNSNATLPILLVTDGTYHNGDVNASTSCDVFYAFNGEVQNMGELQSSGTAYPIRYNDQGIYTSGGHHVIRYIVDETERQLIPIEYANEKFDTEGNATYVAYNEEKGEQLMGNDASYFETMFDQYGRAVVADFEQAK